MQELSEKETLRRKLIEAATKDYLGAGVNVYVRDTIIFAIIKKRFEDLHDDYKTHALHIMSNLSDKTYRASLLASKRQVDV